MSAELWVVLLLFTFSLTLGGHTDLREPDGQLHELLRVKRAKVDRRWLTTKEKQDMLDLHNKYRREVPASDMTLMEWDSDLERRAQEWADKCIWRHSKNRYSDDYRYIGENLYAKTNIPSALDVVNDWYGEKDDYNYYTQQCNGVCGHYTQVVWAESHSLGCGIRFCNGIEGLDWERYGGGYVVVCSYGPGGNIVGQRPYIRAQPPCSACPRTHKYCIQGLCSKTKETVPISASNIVVSSSMSFLAIVVSFCLS